MTAQRISRQSAAAFEALLKEVRNCRACEAQLPLGPKPIVRAHPDARVLIVGQAPGIRVHKTGFPWNDPSGDRLRTWMGIDRTVFYDERKFAIIPMGFCYPGKGRTGDLPPRKECARLWLDQLLAGLPNIQFTILAGNYAHQHYLGKRRKMSLTQTVRAWKEYLPDYLPLPHPSPRNRFWLSQNPWFENEVVPFLKNLIRSS